MYSGKFLDSFINQITTSEDLIYFQYVFDGAPPQEKQEVLDSRKEHKLKIQQKVEELEALIKDLSVDETERKKELEIQIKQTQKKCINITREDVDNLKKIFDIMGVKYIQTDCEADLICCSLFNGKVDACLSNDMECFLPFWLWSSFEKL